MKTALMFIYTESSLHAGTGSSVSVVDLPIQRERATQYPIVQGSGVKGALRSQWLGTDEGAAVVFGPDTKGAAEHAGAVSVGEARIVLFPVRSLAGVFAYVTCPHVLSRLSRDLAGAGQAALPDLPKPQPLNALVTQSTDLDAGNKHTVLEEFDFAIQPNAAVSQIAKWLSENAFPKGDEYAYWRKKVQDSLIVLRDDDFREFVVSSTEIVTRVRLETVTKTVADGALWTQEALPADALLYSSIIVRAARKQRQESEDRFVPAASAEEVHKALIDPENIAQRIQIGGDETTGSGMVALRWAYEER